MIIYEKNIHSTFDAVDEEVHVILDRLASECKIEDKSLLFRISFMLRELLNNGVEHGNLFDASKYVACRVSCANHALKFVIKDQGGGIVWDDQAQHLKSDDLPRERTRGYTTIHDMAFKTMIEGNQVTVTYDLTQEDVTWKSI